jgi:hypothetical protein
MTSTEEKTTILLMYSFEPDKWGQVRKFSKFYSSTYSLPLYAIIALRGIEGHFHKYFILKELAQKMVPKLVEDHEQLANQGYSPAVRSKELAAIIDTLFCELYSVVDCTRSVLGAIYGKCQNVPTKSTSKLFKNAGEEKIDDKVPSGVKDALKHGQNDWFPRLKEIRDAINHSGIGSCNEDEGKISYYHDSLGQTPSNVLVNEDVLKYTCELERKVHDFLENVFYSLNMTLDDNETIQYCGIFGGLGYQRTVSISEAKDFNSGRCKSIEQFEKDLMPTCPCINSCGAYERVLKQRNADK